MAGKKPLDVRGYYKVLKVSPEAPPDEIRLAYAMSRQNAAGPHLARIERAFETLKDAGKRAAYDREGLRRPNPLKSPYALPVCVAVLIIVLGVLYLPGLLRGRRTFRDGQTLLDVRTGREFGVVVRSESAHRFPQGTVAPAYLVRPAAGGQERWYPASDLLASCEGK